MSRARLEQVLTDFSVAATHAAGRPACDARSDGTDDTARASQLGRLAETARAEGFAAGATAAKAQFDLELRALTEAHEAELMAEQARWIAELSETLSASLVAGLAALERRLHMLLARVLWPLAHHALQRRALDDLHAAVLQRLRAHPAVSILASGPPEMMASVGERLRKDGFDFAIRNDPAPRIELRIDETVIAADLGRLSEQFERALHEQQ